jgi:hypothetical protein
MTAGDGWQRKDVQVHHDGEVLVITLDRSARCIRIMLQHPRESLSPMPQRAPSSGSRTLRVSE